MKTALIRFFCGLVLCSAVPVFAAGPNLCQQQEDTLFSCQLQNKKFVAACAQNDPVHQDQTGIVYRFGTPDHLEISLPKNPGAFRQSTFVDEAINDKPTEDDIYLRFVNGAFTYVLYNYLLSTAPGSSPGVNGLAVFRNGQLLSRMSCLPATLEFNLGRNSLLALGVQPEADSKQAFRFWSQILPKNSDVLAQKPFGDPKYRSPSGKNH